MVDIEVAVAVEPLADSSPAALAAVVAGTVAELEVVGFGQQVLVLHSGQGLSL